MDYDDIVKRALEYRKEGIDVVTMPEEEYKDWVKVLVDHYQGSLFHDEDYRAPNDSFTLATVLFIPSKQIKRKLLRRFDE